MNAKDVMAIRRFADEARRMLAKNDEIFLSAANYQLMTSQDLLVQLRNLLPDVKIKRSPVGMGYIEFRKGGAK